VAVDVWGTGKHLYEQTGGIAGGGRVRQHINPLKTELQKPTAPPNWRDEFEDCSLPLQVDVGCGSGRFILARARSHVGEANFLGLDIRSKLVERSNKWAKFLNIPNVFYLSSNATISLETVLRSYPGKVTFVSVQYPDPHFKKKHHKRRIVQSDFIEQLGRVLDRNDGHVFLQSDILEVAQDMCKRFDQSASFRRATQEEILELAQRNYNNSQHKSEEPEQNHDDASSDFNQEGWITFNPSGMPTEREVHATADGEEVYRALFRKS
jgi:tRNA (guanine-N7-)-methyltransferase